MNLTIESIFKQHEMNVLCEELSKETGTSRTISLLLAFIFGGAALYGFTMGLQTSLFQAAASSLKVFVLFFFTLIVCLPTLHFISLLFGAKTKFVHITVILLAGMAITNVLLGAFAPISLFFLLSGMQYELLVVLHVGIFACCGAAGLLAVKRNMLVLRGLLLSHDPSEPQKHSDFLLKIWFLLYMFVGTQMSYLLAPFIQAPHGVLLFNDQRGDFYSYLFKTIVEIFQ